MDEMGEDVAVYAGVFGSFLGDTEARMSIYEGPAAELGITDEISNLELAPGAD